MGSVVLEPLATERPLARSRRTRGSCRAASPTPGRASPRRPAALTCPSPIRKRPPESRSSVTAVIAAFAGERPGSCMIAVPSLSVSVVRSEPGERRNRIDPPGLCRPGRVVAQALRLARQLDQLERVRPRWRIAHVEAELHQCDAMTMTTSHLCPTRPNGLSRCARSWTSACFRTSSLLDQRERRSGCARRDAP